MIIEIEIKGILGIVEPYDRLGVFFADGAFLPSTWSKPLFLLRVGLCVFINPIWTRVRQNCPQRWKFFVATNSHNFVKCDFGSFHTN